MFRDTCIHYVYVAANTGNFEARSQNIGSEWQHSLTTLTSLMTSAPHPSSTAISSGLVGYVSVTFPSNGQFQVRSISTRGVCTKPGTIHLKFCIGISPVLVLSYIRTRCICVQQTRVTVKQKARTSALNGSAL